MAEVISSAANPLVKRVRALADRKHRRRESAFVVQGIQPVWQAVEAGAEHRDADRCAGPAPPPRRGRDGRRAGGSRASRVARLSGELFGRIADRDGPSGPGRDRPGSAPVPLAGLAVGAGSLFVALHSAGNPGNVGTIIRTASAVGAGGRDPDRAVRRPLRSGRGQGEHGRAVHGAGGAVSPAAAEFLDWAAASEVTVAATSARGERVVLGRRAGAAARDAARQRGRRTARDDLLAAAGLRVAIPMTGTAESLNLAVAAGVLLYEVRRRTGLPVPLDRTRFWLAGSG